MTVDELEQIEIMKPWTEVRLDQLSLKQSMKFIFLSNACFNVKRIHNKELSSWIKKQGRLMRVLSWSDRIPMARWIYVCKLLYHRKSTIHGLVNTSYSILSCLDSGSFVSQINPGAQCGDTLLCRTGLTDFEGLPRDARWGIQGIHGVPTGRR